MRRITLVVLMGALLLALAGGTALAVKNVQCTDDPCKGESNMADRIFERVGKGKDDTIRAMKGPDVVDAANFRRDDDLVNGQRNSDRLRTDDGDDRDNVICGPGGNDIAVADQYDEVSPDCESVRGNAASTLDIATATRGEIMKATDPIATE